MVARLIEGFESSTVMTDYNGKWSVLANVGIGTGRFGNGCIGTVGTQGTLQRMLDSQPTWIVGFALRADAFSSSDLEVVRFADAATNHCGVALNNVGAFFAFRGTTTTVIGGPSAVSMLLGVWNYVEVKVTINDTTGVVVVRLNGVVVLNLTNVDTRNVGTTATANTIRFYPLGTSFDVRYDDIYIFDATGTVNNDFAGDCKVEQVLPTGAGASTLWTPSAGANWDCVNEVPPNGDTDYVSSATAGQTDTYAFGDLAVAPTGTVKAVQATATARKDDAGSRSIAVVARPGGTDRVGTTQAIADAYATYPQVWDTNPDTAAGWTVAEVNASQFGVRLVA